MRYPWWYVPFLTSPMLIAVVSVIHVLLAHYAVGGGMFLAVEAYYAYRRRNAPYLEYLRKHARFFMYVTVVFGAVTGVGIWWTIGLASPLATEVLIRTFVFAWATEWVTFVVELVTVFLFAYGFGRTAPRWHVAFAAAYAAAAWLSLVIITAITAFMLNPGRWIETPTFAAAFFNPQFLPQVISRTGGALMLCTLYVYLHTSFTVNDADLRDLVQRRSTRPALLGAVLICLGGLWWYAALPASSKAALAAASVLNLMMVGIFALTVVVFFALYVGPASHPGWLTPGFSLLLFLCGLAAFSTGEFIREAVRKPYIVYNFVTGNQLTIHDTKHVRREGVLNSYRWLHTYVRQHYPELIDSNGRVLYEKLPELAVKDRIELGRAIFLYCCNNCHAEARGYSAVGYLIHGWNRDMILRTIHHLHEADFFMPPWPGNAAEAELLADYLYSIAPEKPRGMLFGVPKEEESNER